MAHFVAFCIGFQKNIPLQNPPGGYMAAQGLQGYAMTLTKRHISMVKVTVPT